MYIFFANCQLPTANCQLPTANCQLPTANCQLAIPVSVYRRALCALLFLQLTKNFSIAFFLKFL